MICQNVNPGRKVQRKYVGHAELCNIILNWGCPCLISVKKKNIKNINLDNLLKEAHFAYFISNT